MKQTTRRYRTSKVLKEIFFRRRFADKAKTIFMAKTENLAYKLSVFSPLNCPVNGFIKRWRILWFS